MEIKSVIPSLKWAYQKLAKGWFYRKKKGNNPKREKVAYDSTIRTLGRE